MKLALASVCAVLLITAGCSSSTLSTATQQSVSGGPVFVVGTDAAATIPAVVGVKIQLEHIYLTNSSTKSNDLLASPTIVDFARYNGLQGLVDENPVEPGDYTGVEIDLGTSDEIDYLNTSSPPPTITPLTATVPSTPIDITLPNPLTVGGTTAAPVGLRIDLNLAQSLTTSGGDITGAITPVFDVSTVARTDTGGHIDEFIGGVVTPPTSTTVTSTFAPSFVIDGPHGESFNISVNSSTEWDSCSPATAANCLAQLETDGTNAIVAVAGAFDPAAQTLDADEVAIISDTNFAAHGMVTYVTPSSGKASEMQFYVRSVLPSKNTYVPLGGLADVSITGSENYGIYWMHNAFTNMLFNDAALTPGQEISVGGTDPTASPFDVKRIHLHNWGYVGTVKAGSENPGQGTFQMNVTGFSGQVITSPITVYLGTGCDFRYGFGAFSDVTDNEQIRVVGLLLDLNGQVVLVARHIDGNNFTDMTATAWQ